MEVRVPPSKSISNRALILALQHGGVVRHVLSCDDTDVVIDSFDQLGVQYEILEQSERWFDIKVEKGPLKSADLFLGNAGTAVRFLLPVLAKSPGDFTMMGVERMLKRPIGDLVDALRHAGARIDYISKEGYLPLGIVGQKLSDKCNVKADVSSQYVSGLMLAGFDVEIIGKVVSKPYIEMTRRVIENFGDEFVVPGDASSATYWWALNYVTDAHYEVENVSMDNLQADTQFLQAAAALDDGDGLNGIGYHCRDFPDGAMTLAMLCAVAKGTSRLTGLSTLEYKECDRLQALETELRKVGVEAKAFEDGIEITGVKPSELKPAKIETYNDHRIAMCFAVLKVLQPGIEIMNPECVSKTYPTFWDEFPVSI